MFRDSYQRGLLTIFFSCGSKPLKIWDTCTQDGYITKFLDEEIRSTVFEIGGTNVSTTYMTCPKGKQVLGITMPFLVMIVKNIKKYFSFEITILDDTGTRRRFRVSNFQSTTQILPLCTVMPIALSDGWNQIQFNMSDFCRRAYQKQFVEVQKCKINANIRIRRIYFADRIFTDDKLPPEYKLFIPLKKSPLKGKPKTDEVVAPATVPTTITQEEKRSSKVLEKPPSLISTKSATKAVATEGAPDQTMAAEGAPDQTMATEGAPDQTMATEEPVAVGEEPVATDETLATDEAATEITEPITSASQVQEEKRSSKVLEKPPSLISTKSATEAAATEGAPDQTMATEGAPDQTTATEGAPDQPMVTEDAPDQTMATEEPAAVGEEPVATGETPATVEAATETTEPVKVTSATQHEPVSVEDKATDGAE